MQGIGPREHGPTNVLQITLVFDRDGDLKGASGYERDHAGATFGQWRSATGSDPERESLMRELPKYLLERVDAIAAPM